LPQIFAAYRAFWSKSAEVAASVFFVIYAF
jgi:hypothetical protein